MRLALMLSGLLALPALGAACPPEGYDRAELEALKAANFEIADDASRQSLARALIPCLAHPDPSLRDGVTFEAYSTWMRGNRLDVATRTELLRQLQLMLEPDPADRAGFRQSFAALVLSEVARTDRVAGWMSPAQRSQLVERAAKYLASVRDYRGFDDREGWRHGVAHAADLATQLVLNASVDRAGIDRLLAAVAAQVAPVGHAYVDGESERLARPVLVAAQRGLHTPAEWQKWLQAVAAPAPLASWGAAFQSREGLARRHDVVAFLYALYVNARESSDAQIQVLVPALQAAFKTL